jgi:hypothetical protein
MEQKPILMKASFEFTQDGNCCSSESTESLTIECESSLGIDNDGGCFYVLKTKQWSIDSTKDLQDLINRINKVIEIKESKI